MLKANNQSPAEGARNGSSSSEMYRSVNPPQLAEASHSSSGHVEDPHTALVPIDAVSNLIATYDAYVGYRNQRFKGLHLTERRRANRRSAVSMEADMCRHYRNKVYQARPGCMEAHTCRDNLSKANLWLMEAHTCGDNQSKAHLWLMEAPIFRLCRQQLNFTIG